MSAGCECPVTWYTAVITWQLIKISAGALCDRQFTEYTESTRTLQCHDHDVSVNVKCNFEEVVAFLKCSKCSKSAEFCFSTWPLFLSIIAFVDRTCTVRPLSKRQLQSTYETDKQLINELPNNSIRKKTK